jgi:hypothetical protein
LSDSLTIAHPSQSRLLSYLEAPVLFISAPKGSQVDGALRWNAFHLRFLAYVSEHSGNILVKFAIPATIKILVLLKNICLNISWFYNNSYVVCTTGQPLRVNSISRRESATQFQMLNVKFIHQVQFRKTGLTGICINEYVMDRTIMSGQNYQNAIYQSGLKRLPMKDDQMLDSVVLRAQPATLLSRWASNGSMSSQPPFGLYQALNQSPV